MNRLLCRMPDLGKTSCALLALCGALAAGCGGESSGEQPATTVAEAPSQVGGAEAGTDTAAGGGVLTGTQERLEALELRRER